MIDASDSVSIRAASIDDVDAFVRLRVALFEAMPHTDSPSPAVADAMRAYFLKHLPTGAFRVWMAECDGTPVASVGLVIHSVPPSPRNVVGKEGYIMNLITLPGFRRRGIARRLMTCVLDVVRLEGIPRVSLHAAPEGQRLYAQLGFVEASGAPEMTRALDP